MYYLKRLLFFYFLVICNLSYSQDILWEKSFGGQHDDILTDVISTPDNGFVIAGSSVSSRTGNKSISNHGDFDYWIVKVDEDGRMVWQKGFGGVATDKLQNVLSTNDGGFLLGGTSNSNKSFDKKEDSKGENDFWLIKLNAKGDEEWQKTIGGEWQDELQSIIATNDGGYLLGGSSSSNISKDKTVSNYGGLDYWLVKIDGKGSIEWQKSFGGIFEDRLKSLCQTNDSGFIIGGDSNSIISGNKTENNFGESDYWLLKIDSRGNLVWQKTIGGINDDQLFSILKTKNNDFYIGGSSVKPSNEKEEGTDFWIIKINETAEIIWEKYYNNGKVDILNSLIETSENSLILGGLTKSEIKLGKKSIKNDIDGVNDFLIMNIDKEGNELWKKTLGSNGEDFIKKVIEIRDGSYVLGGTSNPFRSRFVDYDYNRENNKQIELNLYSSSTLNDNVDLLKQELKNDLNKEILKAKNEINSFAGNTTDLPISIKTNENSLLDGLINHGNFAEGVSKKPEKKLPISREKSDNFGNNDFWVIKLKDKEKPTSPRFDVEAYPNPTAQFTNIIIGYDFEIGSIIIADLAGHILQQFEINEKTIPIDLSDYPDGIYIVSIKTNKQENSVKIIKGNKSKQ